MTKSKESQANTIVEGETISEDVSKRPLKERAEGYAKDLEAISLKWHCQLVIYPALKARDDGSFSIVMVKDVGELPKQG